MKLHFQQELAITLRRRVADTADGALYEGEDEVLRRKVAVKQVRIPGQTPQEQEANRQKAMQEVTAMAQISDLTFRVPKFYGAHYDKEESLLSIVMEWIPGKSLEKHMGICSNRQMLRWMADLCAILKVMDKKNLHHKDIKPANLMITGEQSLYLIDFNISLSLANTVEGTEHYKAPETDKGYYYQGRDKVDMFAIGVILYEHFTGKLPVRGEHYTKPMIGKNWKKLTEPKELNPDISDEVNTIICTCMQRDPAKRYGSYAELEAALLGKKGYTYGARK